MVMMVGILRMEDSSIIAISSVTVGICTKRNCGTKASNSKYSGLVKD